MPFSFFKKKKDKVEDERPAYDITNLHVRDLRVGFLLDYNFKTWIVKEEYEYDWGDFEFSYEYRLVSEDEEIFLSIEDDDTLELTVSTKIKASKLDEEIFDRIEEKGKPPRKIEFELKTFHRENESPGFYRNTATHTREQSSEFVAWEYYDESETKTLTIEQWGEDDFEVSVGKTIGEDEITNIIPGEASI